jgi:hypothetical protein
LSLPNPPDPLWQALHVCILSIQANGFQPGVECTPGVGDFHALTIESFFDATPQFQLSRALL